MKGLLVAFVVGVPFLVVTLLALAKLGIGDPSSGALRTLRFTVFFAGIPALLSLGGISSAAHRAANAEPPLPAKTIRQDAIRSACVAGIALLIVAAIPMGGLPERPLSWLWLAIAGATCGAPAGVVIALWATLDKSQRETETNP